MNVLRSRNLGESKGCVDRGGIGRLMAKLPLGDLYLIGQKTAKEAAS